MEFLEFNTKDVFWGRKYECEGISKNVAFGKECSEYRLFVKIKHNDYRDVFDLYNANCKWFPKFYILKQEMPHYKLAPKKVGDVYIKDIKPFASEKRTIDIVELAFIAANQKRLMEEVVER